MLSALQIILRNHPQAFTADSARSPESYSPSRKLLLILMSQSRVFRPWRRASSRYCLPIDSLGVIKVPKASNVRRWMRRFMLRSREEGTKLRRNNIYSVLSPRYPYIDILLVLLITYSTEIVSDGDPLLCGSMNACETSSTSYDT